MIRRHCLCICIYFLFLSVEMHAVGADFTQEEINVYLAEERVRSPGALTTMFDKNGCAVIFSKARKYADLPVGFFITTALLPPVAAYFSDQSQRVAGFSVIANMLCILASRNDVLNAEMFQSRTSMSRRLYECGLCCAMAGSAVYLLMSNSNARTMNVGIMLANSVFKSALYCYDWMYGPFASN